MSAGPEGIMRPSKAKQKTSPRQGKPFDVFICYKRTNQNALRTEDARWARKTYDALRAEGIRTFFDEAELQRGGKGHFTPQIEAALEASRVLILVASCRAHVEAGWVRAEWGAFLNLLRSGKEGQIFILSCGDMQPDDLPTFLREVQVVPHSDIKRMVQFVRNALPRGSTLGDFVRHSLHCHRPKHGEDKVYVVTVRDDEDGYQVKAHWGPRESRRLKSQLKGAGITGRKEAEALADDLRREKERVGYRAKNLKSLLTPEALKLLEVDLALATARSSAASSSDARPTPSPSSAKGIGDAQEGQTHEILRQALLRSLGELATLSKARARQLAAAMAAEDQALAFLMGFSGSKMRPAARKQGKAR